MTAKKPPSGLANREAVQAHVSKHHRPATPGLAWYQIDPATEAATIATTFRLGSQNVHPTSSMDQPDCPLRSMCINAEAGTGTCTPPRIKDMT